MNFLSIIPQALAVLGDVASLQSLDQTVADATTLYQAYEQHQKTGKLDVAAMVKAGTLTPTVDAAARMSSLVSAVLHDNTKAAQMKSLLEDVEGLVSP